MDKITLKSKIMEMISNQERVKELARYCSDRCTDLKPKVVKLNSEKQQIKLQSTNETTKSDIFGEIKL